jgi:hypothetical protein
MKSPMSLDSPGVRGEDGRLVAACRRTGRVPAADGSHTNATMLIAVRAIAALALFLGGCAAPPSTAGPAASPSTQGESPSTSATASPAITSQPSVRPVTSEQPDALPTLPPFPGIPTLGGHMSELEAGCRGTIYYKTKALHADQCGLPLFDEVLRLDRLTASPGERLLIEAPDGYAFSVADAQLSEGWSVRIAPSSALRRGVEIPLGGMEPHVGHVVARGLGPNARVRVKVPAKKGTYVVELTGPLARDGWTFPGSLYYWLVKVG